MTSMISYFGKIRIEPTEASKSCNESCWDYHASIGDNVSRMKCPYKQLSYLLDQALAVAVYVRFYGLRCHEQINDYIEELNTDICGRFARTCGKEFKDNYRKVYNTLMDLVKFNRGGNWNDVDIPLLSEFLFNGDEHYGEPRAWRPSWKVDLQAFLLWMNRRPSGEPELHIVPDGNTGIGMVTFSFETVSDVYEEGEPLIFRVEPRGHVIGTSFSYEKTPLDALYDYPALAMLSHFNLSTVKFETLVGVLMEYCIHLDIERFGLSKTHIMAYLLRIGCMYPAFNLSQPGNDIEPVKADGGSYGAFNSMLKFVKFCTESRGLGVVDKDIVAKAFGSVAATKEQKDSVAYLQNEQAVPSADAYKTFNKVMGAVEAFKLISQNPTLITAQTVTQVTGATEAADPAGGGEDNANKSEAPAGDNPDAGENKEEPKEGGKEGDDSEPSPDDAGSSDFPSDDTPGMEPEGGDDQGDGSTDDPGGSSFDENSVPSNDAPPEPKTSDDKGIPFTITQPESSTVDSVLFREEMYKFISNVLTNPPKCMSPQDVETLNALRKYWLSCLSIDTIKGIVEACIRLPKSIKNNIQPSKIGEEL